MLDVTYQINVEHNIGSIPGVDRISFLDFNMLSIRIGREIRTTFVSWLPNEIMESRLTNPQQVFDSIKWASIEKI